MAAEDGAQTGDDGDGQDEKTVLITGCSSGIGRATAHQFLKEGWTVYATARDTDDIDDLAAKGCRTAALDVTDPEAPTTVIDRIIEAEGHLDCLVNNAGYAQRGTIEDVPPRKVRHQFDVNVFGPHRLIRAALPQMRAANDGTIINISSFFGRVSAPGMGVYAGSKVALEAFSDAVRGEVDHLGIDVVLIEPGPVDTKFVQTAEQNLREIEHGDDYDDIYAFYDDAFTLSDSVANDPEAVATTIYDAAVTSNPAPRYTVGVIAKLAVLFRYVPHPIRDTLYGLLRKLV